MIQNDLSRNNSLEFRKDLVSVVMPAYNSETTIRESIQSVINQDYPKIELIVVNDGSTDGTDEIIKEIIAQNTQLEIIYISKDKNQGVAEARNTAFSKAKGEYLAFLDSDDIWYPTKLIKQVDSLKSSNGYFSITSYEVIDEESRYLGKYLKVPTKVSYKSQLKGSSIGCLTVLLDRKVIGNDIHMLSIGHEDYLAWQQILRKYGDATPLRDVLAKYRVQESSRSSNKMRSAKWQYKIYTEHLKINPIQALYYEFRYMVNALSKYRK